jgi:alpha-N-arabinofuranosidase
MESSPVKYLLGDGRREMPGLIGSASTRGGVMTLSVVNPHATLPVEAEVELRGIAARHATVTALRDDELNAHNTFEEPDALRPQTREIELDAPTWRHVFAPASVTVLRIG